MGLVGALRQVHTVVVLTCGLQGLVGHGSLLPDHCSLLCIDVYVGLGGLRGRPAAPHSHPMWGAVGQHVGLVVGNYGDFTAVAVVTVVG